MTDEDLMPFGKYKGKKMQDVPASYLHWLWFDAGVKYDRDHKLHSYILDMIPILETENPDLIWS